MFANKAVEHPSSTKLLCFIIVPIALSPQKLIVFKSSPLEFIK